jgi:hypothetical protein
MDYKEEEFEKAFDMLVEKLMAGGMQHKELAIPDVRTDMQNSLDATWEKQGISTDKWASAACEYYRKSL